MAKQCFEIMKKLPLLLLPLLLLVACDSPKKTIEALQRHIAAYSIEPTPTAEEKIRAGFEKLDADISKLNAAGKSSEAEALQRQVDALRSQYDTARLAGSLQKARNAIEGFGQSVKNLGQQIGEVFKPTPTPVSE
jgi:predicted  nucleic acid-binding Zn-ribbon protein